MNIAEWSIRKSVITWVITVLLVVVGAKSFFNLSWLEDPEFTIKEAVVITPYPGASPAEVEEEVTNVIEKAVQQMGQLHRIESRSSRGLSYVNVVIEDKFDKVTLPQVWDELRRKVSDAQNQLPPGAGPSIVNDDFGDVYGMYVAITGEGYTHREIYDVAKFLQRELLTADGVKKISLYGHIPEVVYLNLRREKMAELGISLPDIQRALAGKSLASPAGNLTIGREYIPVNPTGEIQTEQDFADILIKGLGQGSDHLVYLGDIAEIERGYKDPPDTLLRFDRKQAIGLGISTIAGGNVVKMGAALEKRMGEMEDQIPIGVEVEAIYLQTTAVVQSIKGFLVNLAQAVIIVVVVLLVFMGLRSGLIIGAVLLVTIMGTFVFMNMMDVTLERISLGALVIALGMLVDNAIVVTDGMKVKMEEGTDAITAATKVVGQTATPLLGATLIAVAAFAAIGTSQDSTGEYCRTLFYVILISLTLSWFTAVSITPLFCKLFLKVKEAGPGERKDPYGGIIFRGYRRFLSYCIRVRWATVLVVFSMFAAAIIGFGFVPVSFFPSSTAPQFYVDFWFPEGTHIYQTAEEMEQAEDYLLGLEGVQSVSTFVGGGQLRFLLTYPTEKNYDSFAQALVQVDNYKRIAPMLQKIEDDMLSVFPQVVVTARPFVLGPATGGKIQLRISGPDSTVLRQLAATAEKIIQDDPNTKGIRNEWRNRVKVVRPQMAEAQARRAGIDRPDISTAIMTAIEGQIVGVYRERDELLPIVARSVEAERTDMDNLGAIQVWSPSAQSNIPLAQVVTRFTTEFEDPYIWRRDRVRMVKIHADPREGLPSELFAQLKPKIEQALGVDALKKLGRDVSPEDWDAGAIPVNYMDRLPLKGLPEYYMAWGGEAEDSAKANMRLSASIPVYFGIMVLIVVFLFNSLRKTAVIWLTVPLSIIGVTIGLLLFKQPFGFMALLGLMSLAGMLIKNAIVLIDQIDTELASGKPGFDAIVDSGVSRLIPVSMAALTTILGMMPLLKDGFFISMAVTIMFGLLFATVLTLIFVPVLYAIFFKVAYPAGEAAVSEGTTAGGVKE
jgi:multidrug efflux pump subunit AcrB